MRIDVTINPDPQNRKEKNHGKARDQVQRRSLRDRRKERPAPVTVTETEPWVMWTWGEDLVGQRVTFGFRYEDGTEAGEVVKTIHARR